MASGFDRCDEVTPAGYITYSVEHHVQKDLKGNTETESVIMYSGFAKDTKPITFMSGTTDASE